MKKGIIAVDLFCGAGGLTRGLLDAGITVVKGYDNDPRLKDTYEKNNEGVTYCCRDIATLSKKEILDGLDLKNNYLLMAGCAPCQPFSAIYKSKKRQDARKNLLLEFGRLIAEILPDFIFVENVPGLKNGKGKKIFSDFETILKRNKYNYVSDVLDAKDYGIPQKRRRLILLASRWNQVEIPEPTHGPKGSGKIPFATVREAIGRFPPLRAGKKHASIPNHECRNLSETNKKRLKHIRKNGGTRKDLPKALRLKCHKNHDGHTDVYGRMKWDDFAPTLTCKCISISNGRFGHPTQTRGISVREAAALQSFKKNYVFYGTLTDNTRWVGNVVPVKFAKFFGNYFVSKAGTL